MREKRDTVLIWAVGGLADLSSHGYQEKKHQFLNGILLLERLKSFRPQDEKSALNFIELLEETKKLKETLVSCCKAAETLAAADSKISAEKVFILEEAVKIREVSEEMKKYLREALEKQVLSSAGVKKWLEKQGEPHRDYLASEFVETKNKIDTLVLEPLFSLYSHMKGSIQTTVVLPDGSIKMSSPFVINFLLKNTSEPEKRSRIFNALSASFARNSAVFCDILNTVAGAHILRSARNNQTTLEYALELENFGLSTFETLRESYWEEVAELRKIVKFIGFCTSGNHREQVPVALFGSALPHLNCPVSIQSFDSTIKMLEKAVNGIFPSFSNFIKKCKKGKWIETHNYSGGVGGAWCAEVPSDEAVIVYVDYEANIHRAFETAHILGDAFLRWSTLGLPFYERRLTEVRCEFFGRLFEELLLRHLLECAQKPEEKTAILWHGLRRIMINLIQIPFRFKLIELVYEEREKGYLSVERINELTRVCWKNFFGDTVEGVDQYIWARKPHFYNPVTPHHDFQYTLGFLSANLLISALRGKSAAEAEKIGGQILMDCALLPYEEIFIKNLQIDLEQGEIWKKAIEEALLPMREIKSYMEYILGEDSRQK